MFAHDHLSDATEKDHPWREKLELEFDIGLIMGFVFEVTAVEISTSDLQVCGYFKRLNARYLVNFWGGLSNKWGGIRWGAPYFSQLCNNCRVL